MKRGRKMFSWRRQQKLVKPIYELNKGQKGKIVQIRGKITEQRFFSILGIVVGCDISIDKIITTPRERIITITNGNIELTLDKAFYNNIRVEVPVAVR